MYFAQPEAFFARPEAIFAEPEALFIEPKRRGFVFDASIAEEISIESGPMAIDLDKIPQARRTKLIELGEQFGSQDTLDQANQTLDAYTKHAALIKRSGFGAKHGKELESARDMLAQAGIGRETAKGQKKVNARSYVEAFDKGSSVRMEARAVLTGAMEDLEGESGPDAVEAAHIAATALEQTRVAPDKAEPLARQLVQIQTALKQPKIAMAALDQGGPEAIASIDGATSGLRAADQIDVGVRGTPVETETLDLLDGIIVQLVRRARRAALAASKRLGNPALVNAFKLDKLYRSRAGAPPAMEPEEGEEEG